MAHPPAPSPPSPPKSTTSTSSIPSSTTTKPRNQKTPTPIPPTAPLPTPATLLAAGTTPLYTATSTTPIPFSTLYTTPNNHTTTLLLFIRHFFCGNCQEFLRRLASDLPPSTLPRGVSIAIIGCGSPSLIASYVEALACDPPFPYPIYAEPSKGLHEMLGMQYSLSLGSKSPEYMHRSLLRVNLESTVQGLKRLWHREGDALSGGDMRLNGGEFLVECDRQGKARVVWCHRMENSRGHVEMEVLRGVIRLGEWDVEKEKEDIGSGNGNESEKGTGERPGVCRRRSTAERLRRSFSSRRQSWLGRNGSVGREGEKKKEGNNSSRDTSRRRSLDPGMNPVREEVRSRDGQEKPAFGTINAGMCVVST